MPWEQRFIRDIYEPQRGGRRVVRRAILSIARKNGKSALIAALALSHLVGPAVIPNGEIYSAANDHEQAGIIYKFARQMVEREPELMARLDLIPSTKTMIDRPSGSVYRAVSSEASTKHGYSPSVVIYDELAQSKSRNLYDAFDTAFGARIEPLFIAISTQSNDPEHILSKLIDDGVLGLDPSIICHLYCADEGCALDDEKQWAKANPALGVFRDREDLATAIRKAIRMPAEEPKVRNLFLNQRVSPLAPLVSRAEWLDCIGPAEFVAGEEVYLGLDLASVIDLAALVMVSVADPAKVAPLFWKPAALLAEQSQRDFGSGNNRYQEWANAGLLRLSPGRSIDPAVIAAAIAELSQRFNIRGLAYDRWRIEELLRAFDNIGLQAFNGDKDKKGVGLRLVPWGQGYRDMGPSVDALELAIFEHRLVHPSHPILNWNMANAVASLDPAGNRKLNKDKARFRIDGAVALVMAMGLRGRDRAGQMIDIAALIG
jgi:phage terminase large subunit-like protein